MWNKQNHIEKMTPLVDKMVDSLIKSGINTSVDEILENYHFQKDDRTLKISYHIIYRFSGLSVVPKISKNSKGDETFEQVYVTDEMWLNSYIRKSIELFFKCQH